MSGVKLLDIRYSPVALYTTAGVNTRLYCGCPEGKTGDTLIGRPDQQMTAIHHARCCLVHAAVVSGTRESDSTKTELPFVL